MFYLVLKLFDCISIHLYFKHTLLLTLYYFFILYFNTLYQFTILNITPI